MSLLTFKEKYIVQSTGSVQSTSTSFIDDTQASKTFTLSQTQTVLVIYSANSAHGDTNSVGGFKNCINVDGSDYSIMYDSGYAANYAIRNTCVWVGSLNAGAHTIKGRIACNDASSTATVTNHTLIVYIFDGNEFSYIEDTNALSKSGSAYTDDTYSSITATPSGECKALVFYGVTNEKGVTERYSGKKIMLNIAGSDITDTEMQKSGTNAGNCAASINTIHALSLAATSTTFKGKWACVSTQTVTISRRHMCVLFLADSTVLDLATGSNALTNTSTTLADDTDITITRTLYGELLAFYNGVKKYNSTGHTTGTTYGIMLDDSDVSLSKASQSYNLDSNSCLVAYAASLANESHTIKGRFSNNTGSYAGAITNRNMIALWFPKTLVNKAFSATNDIGTSKTFSSVGDIRLIKGFSAKNDIHLHKNFSSLNDIVGLFTKSFLSSNDVRLSKIFSGTSDISLNKLFSSKNDLHLSKNYISTNDIIALNLATFLSSNDIKVSKNFTASSDIALLKNYSSLNDIKLLKQFASLNDIRFQKVFSSSSDIKILKAYSASSDVKIYKVSTSKNNIYLYSIKQNFNDIQLFKVFSSLSQIIYIELLNKIFASSNDIRASKAFNSKNDLKLSKNFADKSDLQVSKIFNSVSDINIIKSFSALNDIFILNIISSLNDINVVKIFSSKNNIFLAELIYKIFSSSNDIRFSTLKNSYNDIGVSKLFGAFTDIRLSKECQNISDIRVSKAYSSVNELKLSKDFLSKNDVFIFDITASVNDIFLNKKFISENDLITYLTKIFGSENDIQVKTFFEFENNIKLNQIFSTTNKIIIVFTHEDFKYPLTVIFSQNERTISIFQTSRNPAFSQDLKVVTVDSKNKHITNKQKSRTVEVGK